MLPHYQVNGSVPLATAVSFQVLTRSCRMEMPRDDYEATIANSPREFYENSLEYIPNAASVAVEYVDAGHFWSMSGLRRHGPDQEIAASTRHTDGSCAPTMLKNLTARREHGAALVSRVVLGDLVSPVPTSGSTSRRQPRCRDSKLFG